MAHEWREMTLGDFVSLQRGHDLTEPERRPGSVPVFGSAGQNGCHDKALAEGPGIVIGRSGASFGQVHYSPVDYWPHNTALYVTDFKGNDERFAFYFLKALDFTRYNSGSAQPSLNRNFIYPIGVRIPPVNEQQAIACILGSLDDKIELNRRMNRTLEAMARAIFKSWFVDFDPVHAKAAGQQPAGLKPHLAKLFPDRFEDSELGKIPKGWEVAKLADITHAIFSGGTPRTDNSAYWNGPLPWLSSGETREDFIIATEKTITQAGVDESSTRFARAGLTVIASAGQGNTRGQTSMLLLDSYINQSTVAVAANPTRSSDDFLFFDLERRYEEFRQISDSHSSRGSLTTKLLANVRTVLPSYDLIGRFTNVAQPAIERIASTLRESRTLAALRDALLPELISGELRVPDAERIVRRCV